MHPPIPIDDAGNAYQNPDREHPGLLHQWSRAKRQPVKTAEQDITIIIGISE